MKTMNVEKILELLMSPSPKSEAVVIVLAELGGVARTAEIADYLGLDRSNTGRVLEDLAEDGRIVLLDDCDASRRGRPSRVWALA